MTRRWSSAEVRPEERRAFCEEVIAPGNLRRIFWIILVYFPMSLIGSFTYVFSEGIDEIKPVVFLDLGLALPFLVLVIHARRKGPAIRWKQKLALAYYVYSLVVMDAYCFGMMHRSMGDPVFYVLGVVMMAVLVHLPPRQFLPILILNHAVYLAQLSMAGLDSDHAASAIFSSTDGVVLACLAAWWLFHREWDNFEKERVIDRRNQELQEANEKLRQSNDELNETMAVLAHDLRSPLCGMSGFFEMLREQPAWKAEPYVAVVAQCGTACGGLVELVNRLLESHAAGRALAAPAQKRVDLVELARRAAERLRPGAESRAIRIDTPSRGPLEVETDPEAIDQVLANLLSNAVKFSPARARVTVEMGPCREGWWIEVHDEGPGISAGDEDRLFSRFHRGSIAPPGGEPGTGLGLFIVSQRVQALGGSVEYRPGVGGGAIFRVTLPGRGAA